MPTYRKRPATVTAQRWMPADDESWDEAAYRLMNWTRSYGVDVLYYTPSVNSPIGTLSMHTSGGELYAFTGDYLIRDVNGQFYFCGAGTFDIIYEYVGDTE